MHDQECQSSTMNSDLIPLGSAIVQGALTLRCLCRSAQKTEETGTEDRRNRDRHQPRYACASPSATALAVESKKDQDFYWYLKSHSLPSPLPLPNYPRLPQQSPHTPIFFFTLEHRCDSLLLLWSKATSADSVASIPGTPRWFTKPKRMSCRVAH